MVSTMREPNLKGNNLDSDSEVDANDDSLARKWEIKADEIKVNYNDSTSKLGSGAFGVVYKVHRFFGLNFNLKKDSRAF